MNPRNFSVFRLGESAKLCYHQGSANENSNPTPQMPTSKLTQPLTIKPQRRTDNRKKVVSYNLKRLKTRIEQVINSFPKDRPHVLITAKTKDISGPRRSVEITITMTQAFGGPDDTPPHPPRKVVWG